MAAYPVTFDIQQQETYDRTQIAIRILIMIILGILSIPITLLYLGIPVVGAILISQKGPKQYLDEAGENMTKWLRYGVGFLAYMDLLTDKLPTEDPKTYLRFEVTPDGEPTTGGTLLRIITVIPHAIVLWLLSIVAFVLLIIGAVMILVQQRYAEGIFNFLRGYDRWMTRVAAYMAGLVQAYPPFALDTGPETAMLPPASASDEPRTT